MMSQKFPLKLKKVSNSTKWALFSFRYQSCLELKFEHEGKQGVLFQDFYELFNTPDLLAQSELRNIQGRDNNQFALLTDKKFIATAADKEMLLVRGELPIEDIDQQVKAVPFHYRQISRFKGLEGKKVIINSLHAEKSESFTDPQSLIEQLREDRDAEEEMITASISDFRISCEFLESRFYSSLLGFGAKVKETIYIEGNKEQLYLRIWGEDINQLAKPLTKKTFFQTLKETIDKYSGLDLDDLAKDS